MTMGNMNFCQSCGMPMMKAEDFGTNADDSINNNYCTYCFQKGEFTEPDITMEEMVDKCSEIFAQMKQIPVSEAKEMNMQMIPNLKRWR